MITQIIGCIILGAVVAALFWALARSASEVWGGRDE